MSNRFAHNQFVIRQKVLTLLGQKFHVFGPQGELVLFCKQKAFKLREDLRLYADEAMTTEVMAIRTPHVLDFGATYQIDDTSTNQPVGSVQRKGMKSLLRDEWSVFNVDGREIAKVREDSTGLAIARRLIGDLASVLMPQSFHLATPDGHGGERTLATYHYNRNPIVKRLTIDLTSDPQAVLDRRLAIAVGLLLSAIEGKQN